MDFGQVFKQISPEEIPDDVFTLFGKVFPVVTVRTSESCNAMFAQMFALGVILDLSW